jgi:LEA14-like dessication related protein
MDSFESYSENPRGLLRQGRWSFVAAVLVIGALGCTSLGSIEPLDVTLANLDITEVTVFETTLVAKIRITNPNPEALTIEGASFKLYLEDKKVATGTSKESFTVDRLDSNVIDVIFHMNNASALLRLKDILEDEDKEVSYGVRGGLYTQGAFGTKKLKVNKIGTIDLTDARLAD